MDRLFVNQRSGGNAVFADQVLTPGAAPDTLAPSMNGSLSAPVIGTTGFTLAWQAATDDKGVVGYEVSTNGGANYTDVGNVLTYSATSRTPNTPHQARVRARDAANNRSDPLALLVTTAALPIETPEVPDLAARFARPYQDVAAGTWLPSSGTSLAAMINEPTPNSADFIYATEPGAAEIKLGPVKDPGTNSGQKIRYQAWDEGAGALTVRLKQGELIVAGWHHVALPIIPTEFVQALTPEQCNSITDYTDLRLEFVAV